MIPGTKLTSIAVSIVADFIINGTSIKGGVMGTRRISVAYEEVVSTGEYATARFRIGEEYDIEVPDDNGVADMLVCGEFDKASKAVKQAVKHQLGRLQDPITAKMDTVEGQIVYKKAGLEAPKHRAELSPAVLQAMEELEKGTVHE